MSGSTHASQRESTTGLAGNQSGAATNAAIKKSNPPDTTAQEIAGTLPASTRISNTVHDAKGGDKTVPNQVNDAPGEGLRSLGAGGDEVRPADFQSHEIDLPGSAKHAGAGFSHRVADPKNEGSGNL